MVSFWDFSCYNCQGEMRVISSGNNCHQGDKLRKSQWFNLYYTVHCEARIFSVYLYCVCHFFLPAQSCVTRAEQTQGTKVVEGRERSSEASLPLYGWKDLTSIWATVVFIKYKFRRCYHLPNQGKGLGAQEKCGITELASPLEQLQLCVLEPGFNLCNI